MSINNNNTSHNDSRNSRTENLYRDLADLYQLEQQDRQVEFFDLRSVLRRRYQHLKGDSVDCYVSYCNERFRASKVTNPDQLGLDIDGVSHE